MPDMWQHSQNGQCGGHRIGDCERWPRHEGQTSWGQEAVYRGEIVAKPFNITPEVATSAIKNLVNSTTEGIPYWGEGDFHLDGMKRIIEVQKSVGALTGDIDLSKVVDTRFLPDDLKKVK